MPYFAPRIQGKRGAQRHCPVPTALQKTAHNTVYVAFCGEEEQCFNHSSVEGILKIKIKNPPHSSTLKQSGT